ncbi:Asparagine synthetase (glutamine-hydrolyzing) 3 [Sporotomaculum syntrophicum]|uniref:asparagine synthase (glutamine-hydrolyzing) n=1 Tax=Sporotomaculum syntrophicum TaxID=182264 RepID=A0A9D2WR75_9FIRM|nr:asparagine synthase-related protein [Sporotomaculum syntrophicum]KAF1086085.1 Asparagine synthetase (glutamine-hydrolyzing) 3 [Sporotomaculum syntrophicum]
MGAIFGILHLTGEQVELLHLQKLETKLRHYGRDKQASELDHNLGLGGCLNIAISQSPEEEPLYSDETFVVTGDVQIYNRPELIARLHAHSQASNLSLLLAAFKKWGNECPKYINGDFVFAIWDKQNRQLLICRDHLGVRPLFYFYNGSSFAFATDQRALLALPFVGRQFDEVTLYARLSGTYHLAPEATYFAQLKRLPAAHLLKANAHGIDIQKYWTPGRHKIILAEEADYSRAMYDIVADAVKIRVSKRAKLGTELSGGLDSSVVTILARRELLKEDKQIVLFSWSPPYEMVDKQPNDERQLVELVCHQEGLQVQYFDPRQPFARNFGELRLTYAALDEFNQEYQYLTAQGVKLILSGQGGDEAASYRYSMYGMFVNGYWRHFWQEARYLANGSPRRLARIIFDNAVLQLFAPLNYLGKYNIFRRLRRPGKNDCILLNKNFAKRLKPRCQEDILYYRVNPVKDIASGDIQVRTELNALLGAHYNVQHLYPLLDHRVVDFAMSIPRTLFLKQGINRYIYRQAFAHILPTEVCNFLSKNDIARSNYYYKKRYNEVNNLILTVNRLQRDLFAEYIDWDHFDKALPMLKENLHIQNLTARLTGPLYEIQQILAEADK